MDTIALTEKLESLRSCVQRIKEKQPRDVDVLKQDIDLQDILALNLTRAIQLAWISVAIFSVTPIAQHH